jgi:cyclophilin family peptidyl-prolyl cis-trans isomerase
LEDGWVSLRAAAQAALAKVDAEMFMTVLSGIDIDPQWSARAALATALGGFAPDLAAARLEQLVRDPDVKVRAAALGAMARLKVPTAGERLLAALADPDPALRMAAANGLGALRPAGAAEALRRAYEAARRDATYIARAALLAALTAVDPAVATPLLREALADADWAMRVRAATLLNGIDRTSVAHPARPAPAPAEATLDGGAALVAPTYSPQAYVRTSRGDIRIELAVLDAPRTVANFVALVRRGFYNGLTWHRIVPDFVAQAGDPRGDGEGGPGYTIRDELNDRPYLRGTVGMALDWKDTGGSQFFITHSPQPHLDARYTVFGTVVAGMEVVDQLLPWDTITSVRVWDGTAWVGESRD